MRSSIIYQTILVIVCLQLASCLFNPGILVTVPFPIQPPHIDLHLPISIDPILINDLQLSSISLKNLDYAWSFTETAASIKISNAAVLFNWKFRADSGQGNFVQTQYDLDLQYKFVKNSKDRIEISIVSSKSKIGHSSVHLGGTTKQIVIVEVTNLILNHAAVTFRKIIERTVSNAVQSFSSILATDPKIYCFNSSSSCAYLNSTLVSPPIISNKTLVIQLNGASYVNGQSSGELNPQTALVKTSSSKIEAQVHVKVLQSILTNVMKLIPLNYTLDVASQFGVIDINTLRISPLFPLMAEYEKPRRFLLEMININADTPIFNSSQQTIKASVNLQLGVLTENPSTNSFEQYLRKPCNGSVQANLKIIYGWKGISLRISSLELKSFECDELDVYEKLVNPSMLLDVKETLFTILRTGVNGQINSKVATLQFNGIRAVLNGKLLAQQAIFDLTLNSISQNHAVNDNSSFKVLLEN